MSDFFPKNSAFDQEDERQEARRQLRVGRIEQLTTQPVDGQVITNRLKEAATKQAQVTEYEIMEIQGELSTALHALDAGDFRSAKSMIQRVIDDLRFIL